jgi:hypothetical protein
MRRTWIAFGVVLAGGLMLLTSMGAFAQPGPRPTTPRQSAAEQRRDTRSEIITERIETMIARFNNNKDRHVAAYNAVKAKVTEIVTTMSAKGYDTSKLQADLVTWDQMVVKAAQDYAAFINLLQNAEQFTPLGSEGQFQSAMAQARAQLRLFRQDSLDVRNYYQTVIRPDVAALAGQSPAATTPGTTPGQ